MHPRNSVSVPELNVFAKKSANQFKIQKILTERKKPDLQSKL